MLSISHSIQSWLTQDPVWWIRGLATKEVTPKVQPKASQGPRHEEATTLCPFIKPLSLTLTRWRTRAQLSSIGHCRRKTSWTKESLRVWAESSTLSSRLKRLLSSTSWDLTRYSVITGAISLEVQGEQVTVVHSRRDTLPITLTKRRSSLCLCHHSEQLLRWKMEVMKSTMAHLRQLNPIPMIMISSRDNLWTKWVHLWHLTDTAVINPLSNKIRKGWDKKESNTYLHFTITMDRLVQTKRHQDSKRPNNLKKGSRKSQNISEFKERISWMALQQLPKPNQRWCRICRTWDWIFQSD